MLLAYVDDSGSESTALFFVVAGFVAPAKQWTDFETDWRATLHNQPRIEYFRFNEAMGLKGEFSQHKGWNKSARDRKIDELTDVIKRHAQLRIHATVRHDEYERYVQSVQAPKRHLAIENPYVLISMQLILTMAATSPGFGIFEPCDFIFDEQGAFSKELKKWYPIFRRQAQTSAKTDIAAYLGRTPEFQNDRKSLPLQAADLYAGVMRRNYIENKVIYMPPSRTLRQLASMPGFSRDYKTAELIRLNRHLLHEGERFYASNPTARRLHKHIKKKKKQRGNGHVT